MTEITMDLHTNPSVSLSLGSLFFLQSCRQSARLCLIDVLILVLLLGKTSRHTDLAGDTFKGCVFSGALDLALVKAAFSAECAEVIRTAFPSGVLAFADFLLAAPPPRIPAAFRPNADQNRLALRQKRESSRKLELLFRTPQDIGAPPSRHRTAAVYEYRPAPAGVKQVLSQRRKRHVDNPEHPVAFLNWLVPNRPRPRSVEEHALSRAGLHLAAVFRRQQRRCLRRADKDATSKPRSGKGGAQNTSSTPCPHVPKSWAAELFPILFSEFPSLRSALATLIIQRVSEASLNRNADHGLSQSDSLERALEALESVSSGAALGPFRSTLFGMIERCLGAQTHQPAPVLQKLSSAICHLARSSPQELSRFITLIRRNFQLDQPPNHRLGLLLLRNAFKFDVLDPPTVGQLISDWERIFLNATSTSKMVQTRWSRSSSSNSRDHTNEIVLELVSLLLLSSRDAGDFGDGNQQAQKSVILGPKLWNRMSSWLETLEALAPNCSRPQSENIMERHLKPLLLHFGLLLDEETVQQQEFAGPAQENAVLLIHPRSPPVPQRISFSPFGVVQKVVPSSFRSGASAVFRTFSDLRKAAMRMTPERFRLCLALFSAYYRHLVEHRGGDVPSSRSRPILLLPGVLDAKKMPENRSLRDSAVSSLHQSILYCWVLLLAHGFACSAANHSLCPEHGAHAIRLWSKLALELHNLREKMMVVFARFAPEQRSSEKRRRTCVGRPKPDSLFGMEEEEDELIFDFQEEEEDSSDWEEPASGEDDSDMDQSILDTLEAIRKAEQSSRALEEARLHSRLRPSRTRRLGGEKLGGRRKKEEESNPEQHREQRQTLRGSARTRLQSCERRLWETAVYLSPRLATPTLTATLRASCEAMLQTAPEAEFIPSPSGEDLLSTLETHNVILRLLISRSLPIESALRVITTDWIAPTDPEPVKVPELPISDTETRSSDEWMTAIAATLMRHSRWLFALAKHQRPLAEEAALPWDAVSHVLCVQFSYLRELVLGSCRRDVSLRSLQQLLKELARGIVQAGAVGESPEAGSESSLQQQEPWRTVFLELARIASSSDETTVALTALEFAASFMRPLGHHQQVGFPLSIFPLLDSHNHRFLIGRCFCFSCASPSSHPRTRAAGASELVSSAGRSLPADGPCALEAARRGERSPAASPGGPAEVSEPGYPVPFHLQTAARPPPTVSTPE